MNAGKIDNNQNYEVFIKRYQNLHTFEKQKGISNWNQSRLVIVKSKTEVCLAIRTLTCWERIQAFFGCGAASLSNIKKFTNLNNVGSLVKSDKLSTYNILSVAKAAFLSKNLISAKVVQQELKNITEDVDHNPMDLSRWNECLNEMLKSKNCETLFSLIKNTDKEQIIRDFLIQEKANFNYQDNSKPALIPVEKEVAPLISSANDEKKVVDLNARNNSNATALFTAVYENPNAVQKLIDAGADINSRDRWGATPLMCALGLSDKSALKTLIEAGADLNIKDDDGSTALVRALTNLSGLNAVKMLIDAGADVNIRDDTGVTALNHAASRGGADFVKMLIDAGADLNAKDNNSATALISAANQKDTNVMQILIKAGADLNAKDSNGATALINAAIRSDTDVMHILVKAEADVNSRNDNGNTVLMVIADRKGEDGFPVIIDVDAMQVLIDAGADVNSRNDNGNTALMIIANRNGDGNQWLIEEPAGQELLVDAVQVLISAGADLQIKNNEGKTALDLVKEHYAKCVLADKYDIYGLEPYEKIIKMLA